MKNGSIDVWLACAFSAVLGMIVLVTFVATGSSGAWVPAYVCFTPMAFFFAALAEKSSRQRIQELEAKIQELEGKG